MKVITDFLNAMNSILKTNRRTNILVDQPWDGLKIGKNSRIIAPRKIDGPQYITIGDETTIHEDSWISAYDHYLDINYSPKINIGNNVYIGGRACITSINEIYIGDGCVISEDVFISDHVHSAVPGKGLIVNQPLTSKGPTRIGMNTFIGFRVSILSGVTLGDNCIVGAHALVNQSFPSLSMIAGVPAKLIKRYSFEKEQWVNIIGSE